MRLAEIKGRKTSDILADPQHKIPEWELEREYRSTYREQLSETEKIDGRPLDWPCRLSSGRHRSDFARQRDRERFRREDRRRAGLRCAGQSRSKPKLRVCAKSIGNGFRRTFSSFFPRAFWKTRPTFTCSSVACDAGRLREVAERGRREIPECVRDRFDRGDSNRRFDPEQSRARHSHHVALHRWRRD